MATKFQRTFAISGAALFLLTSSSLTIAVILSNVQNSHNKSNTGSSTVNPKQLSNKLQGTQLANFTPTSNVPTLQTIDLKEGSGQAVKSGDTVTVDYTGAVAATGTVFQSSLDTGSPVSFGLNSVITGWKNGLVGMKTGGVRRLVIPADQAYGANPPAGSGIPANAPLVFDVTLHSIK